MFGEFTVEVLLGIPLGALLSQVIVGVIADPIPMKAFRSRRS